MKFFYLFLFSILLSIPVFSQCTGDIHLETQADVDNFMTDYGCSVIEGDLIIGDDTFPYDDSDIFDLSALSTISSVEGTFILRQNAQLLNLSGLSNLTQIGGDIKILNNHSLTNLTGFENLTVIGGGIEVVNNNGLQNVSGLESITSISGDLRIEENDALINLSGLDNVSTIGNNLEIIQNSALISLTGFSNLNNVAGNVYLNTCDALSNLNGLENLNSIGGYFSIVENYGLSSFNGLENLSYIGNNLHIGQNLSLININSLQELNTVGGSIDIVFNGNLMNLIGLGSLVSVGENIWIRHNQILNDITEVNNLLYVGGNYNIYENPSLNTCCLSTDNIQKINLIYNNNLGCNSISEILSYCNLIEIETQAFHDENQNNQYDPNEQFLNQSFTLQPDAFYSYSTQNEGANLYLDGYGDYTLFLNNLDFFWALNDGIADSIEIAYLDSTFTDTLHYFPMQPTGDFTLQDIDLSSSITRCNQNTNYWLTYTNTGTTINDGYIQLIPDEVSNFMSANPMPDSTAGDTLYWYYEELFPTHSEQIHIVYEMPNVDFIGDDIGFEANIQTWDGFGDDKAILSSELVCAYDPNDKLVTPEGVGGENYTLFGDTLEYTIRFQNTGNDTAFMVVVTDVLDAALDLNSFRLIANSHAVETTIDGNSRELTFTFENIYLPDSFVNEPGSHGLVKFRILTNDNLSSFIPIQNTANIFFDANPPIITNTVSNTFTDVIPSVFFGKILLEGAYESEGMMSTNLNNLIPLSQPYNLAPYNYSGGETLTSIPENMVDWVLVEARTGTPSTSGLQGTQLLERQAGILLNNGDILNVDGTSGIRFVNLENEQNYHFLIRHRNHLDVISALPLTADLEMTLDFTTNTNTAFGPEQMKAAVDGTALLHSGDANGDGLIQVSDYDLWFNNNAVLNTYLNTDFNLDGLIQTTDYDAWFLNKAKVGVVEVQF